MNNLVSNNFLIIKLGSGINKHKILMEYYDKDQFETESSCQGTCGGFRHVGIKTTKGQQTGTLK